MLTRNSLPTGVPLEPPLEDVAPDDEPPLEEPPLELALPDEPLKLPGGEEDSELHANASTPRPSEARTVRKVVVRMGWRLPPKIVRVPPLDALLSLHVAWIRMDPCHAVGARDLEDGQVRGTDEGALPHTRGSPLHLDCPNGSLRAIASGI